MTNKTVDYYLGLPYTIELHQNPNAGWFVKVKELPGCMSQADTAEEALADIREVMPLWLEEALEAGYDIPEPRTEGEFSGRILVRVPRLLHRDLIEKAEQEGVSLNQYISTTMARAAGQGPKAGGIADDPSWPGLKAALWSVLAAAGAAEDAGAVDERLFAGWADHMLSQVEGALAGGYELDALNQLEGLEQALAAGINRSPALQAFRRAIQMLSQQIDVRHRMPEGLIDPARLTSRIGQTTGSANSSYLAAVVHEERMGCRAREGEDEEDVDSWSGMSELLQQQREQE